MAPFLSSLAHRTKKPRATARPQGCAPARRPAYGKPAPGEPRAPPREVPLARAPRDRPASRAAPAPGRSGALPEEHVTTAPSRHPARSDAAPSGLRSGIPSLASRGITAARVDQAADRIVHAVTAAAAGRARPGRDPRRGRRADGRPLGLRPARPPGPGLPSAPGPACLPARPAPAPGLPAHPDPACPSDPDPACPAGRRTGDRRERNVPVRAASAAPGVFLVSARHRPRTPRARAVRDRFPHLRE